MTSNAYITSASGESSEESNHAISVICYFNIGQDINFIITWTLDPGPWTLDMLPSTLDKIPHSISIKRVSSLLVSLTNHITGNDSTFPTSNHITEK